MKVELQFLNGQKTIVDMLTSTKLSKYFTLAELANNSGDRSIPQFVLNKDVDTFLLMLDEYRVWFNKPIHPNCCFRQAEYNKLVGGISGSQHCKALAVDLPFEELTDAQWTNIRTKWNEICKKHNCIGEAGRYDWGVHLGAFITYSKQFYTFDKRAKK